MRSQEWLVWAGFVLPLFAAPLSVAAQEAPLKVAPAEIVKAFLTDPTAAIAKYSNKRLEMTAKMTMFDVSYSGGGYIFLDGTKFQCVHEEPWAYALPGQIVKVAGQVSEFGILDLTIVEAQGERPAFTVQDLAMQHAKNAEMLSKTYGERWIEIRGKVAKKVDEGGSLIVLAGAGDSIVNCWVIPEELKDVELGQDVRIVGEYPKHVSKHPELIIGRVITKPVESSKSVAEPTDKTKPSPQTPVASMLRTWTSADGRFTVEAELEKAVGAVVYLKTKRWAEDSGNSLKISEADLKFLAGKTE